METVHDSETVNPYCDVTIVGSTVYAQHWATEIVCWCWQNNGTRYRWLPAHGTDTELWDLAHDPLMIFVAHAVGFEKDIWREIMVPVYGFPDIPNERWADTQAVCALKAVPLALEKVLPVLGLGEKDKVGSKLTISLSRFHGRLWREGKPHPPKPLPARTPDLMQRVYQYCGKDVDDEVALHGRLGRLPAAERAVWLLDQRINERGVRLDREYISGAQRVVARAREPLITEFRGLTGFDPGQTAAVVQWVQSQGVELPNLQKQTIAELLGETEDEDNEDGVDVPDANGVVAHGRAGLLETLPVHVRRALAIRSLVGSSSISKLSRMAGCIARDGRVHRLLQYHGTGPGRWTGRLFNSLNFPRGLVRDRATGKPPDPETLSEAITTGDPDAVDALNLGIETAPEQCDDQGRVIAPAVYRPANPIEAVASALRHAIVAAPGCRLVVGDFVQIQARTVLALAGQHDFLELLRQGLDPYCLTAEKIYGKPQGTWDKKNCPVEIRQTGKNTFLGCGFQMGDQKYIDTYLQHMPPGPERDAFAKLGITTYRKTLAPGVPKLWRALEEDALRVVCGARSREPYGIRFELEDGWLTARLLDGKKIYYWNPRRTTRPLPWDGSQSKDCWTYQAAKQGRLVTIAAYGGLTTQNVVMGHERQLLVRAMLRCEKENLPVIFNGYDEIVCEPELAYAKWEHLKQIMEDVPDWARQIKLPIAAEGWVGTRYKKG